MAKQQEKGFARIFSILEVAGLATFMVVQYFYGKIKGEEAKRERKQTG